MRSTRHLTIAAALGAAIFGSGCGGRPALGPTVAPPQLAGTWLGEQNVTSLDGADCLDDALADLLTLPTQFRGTFAQSGTQVTAMLDIDHTGSTCSFAGTLDGDSLTLTSTGCSEPHTIGLRCADGQRRDLLPVSEVLQGTIRNDVFSGSAVEHDDVVDSDTARRVSGFIAQSTFRLARQ